jgi:aryl-alcohol dehydrogenase-like predicted oxidoreductase
LHQPDYSTPLEETMDALNDLVRAGKVLYVGLSNHFAWRVCETLWISDRRCFAPVACVQPLYNMVNRDAEVELFPFCREHGIGVMTYSPLARGVLTGKYASDATPPEGSRAARGDQRIQEAEWREESLRVAEQIRPLADAHDKTMSQFALNWVLGNPIVSAAIIGPRTMAQYEESLGALGWKIEQSALDEIDRLVPPGEHTGYGFNDPHFPIRGRPSE